MTQKTLRAPCTGLAGRITTALLAMPACALAQQAAQDASAGRPAAAQSDTVLEEVVVTGTSVARTALDTPLAATTFDEDRLAMLTVNSQADILNSIPTIKAEGGGGEVAANVFIRGLPSGGQYQFTPLLYDGFPVFSSFGLNSSAYDVYYRSDLGIERLEFVRGGVSNLFGPGSVAGLINYISKTGSTVPESTVQIELAEDDRVRGDFALSGPAGESLFYALSGFYRYDEGPIRTGNETEGFQLRGNLKKVYGEGAGSVTLYGQFIDDQAQFYLPFPLDGQTRKRIRGNDGRKVYSVQTSQVAGLGFQTPEGRFETSITDGVVTEGASVGLAWEHDFGGGWSLDSKVRYADYDHVFDFFLDGDGIVNVPETLDTFLANRQITGDATFTYVDTGEPVPADALLFANRFIDRDRPATDFTAEANLKRALIIGEAEHSFTLGAFYGNARARDFNVVTSYLADFNNEARLVNLTVTDGGVTTIYSLNGLLNAGTGYTNNRHEAERWAVYLADQIDAGRLVFDIGVRYEEIRGEISRELTSTFVTDATTPNLSGDLRDVVWGNGDFLTGKVDTSEWAAAFGVLYKLTDSLNVYANAARGFFFPELRSVSFNALGEPQSYTAEIIEQAEVGLKFRQGRWSGSVSALYTELDDRRFVTFVNAPDGGIIERSSIVSTRSKGLDATLNVRLTDKLSFEGNVTWQDHEYTAFDSNPAFIGNEVVRQPNFLCNAGLFYDDGRFDAALFSTHTGSTYTSESNAIKLDSFDIVRLGAGYKFDLAGQKARVSIDVYNLFDDDGITEGSPRQDTSQTVGGEFFIGRPVLPRRVTARFTVTF